MRIGRRENETHPCFIFNRVCSYSACGLLCETLTLSRKNGVVIFENKVLRKLFGRSQEEVR